MAGNWNSDPILTPFGLCPDVRLGCGLLGRSCNIRPLGETQLGNLDAPQRRDHTQTWAGYLVYRDDVSTKLAAEIKDYDAAAAIDGSLATLGLEYIDLMLIHRPQPWEGFPRRRVPLLLADRPNTCAAGTPEYETV
jgi:hypothetical protein